MVNTADSFVTIDHDREGNELRFELQEDPCGDTWWGYGHTPPDAFIAEVNRWLTHTMGNAEEGFELDSAVAHLYARQDPDDDERFSIVKPDMHSVGPSSDHLVCNEDGCDYCAQADPDFTSWDDHWLTHGIFPVTRLTV